MNDGIANDSDGRTAADCLDDDVTADNTVRLVEVFVDELDLSALGFAGMVPEATGRPADHPAALLKIDLYGHLDRTPSSGRLETGMHDAHGAG